MVARAGSRFLTPADPSAVPFTDVSGLSAEAQRAIAVCFENGSVNGKSDTVFDPYGYATRGQAAKMTWRLWENYLSSGQ